MTPHLTEAQLDDLLSAASTADAPTGNAVRTHLAACGPCREELAALATGLSNFRAASTLLAMLHTPQRPVVATLTSRRFFALPKLVLATGLASVLAVGGVTLSIWHKPIPAPARHASVATPQPVSNEALLEDIDSDLSTSVPPSLQPLDTTTAAGEPTTTSTSN